MKISIILITYNHETYISQALESIEMQKSVYPIEIIVADDKSHDNTLKIIREYAQASPFTYRFLDSCENLGLGKNYRRAFKECSGDFVAVMEGDDYWIDPLRLQKHVDFLQKHPECSMSFNRIVFYFQDNEDYKVNPWKKEKAHDFINIHQLLTGNKIGNLSACVFRNEIIARLRPELFEINFADWMLGMCMAEYGYIAELKEPMSVYRIHDKGLWSGQDNRQQVDMLLKDIEDYNKYFQYKYADEFSRYAAYLERSVKERKNDIVKRYIPPILITLAKKILPPAIMEKTEKGKSDG